MATPAEDVPALALLFARAFHDDPLFRELLPHDAQRARALAALFQFQLAAAPALTAQHDDSIAAAAIWREPQSAPMTAGRPGDQFRLLTRTRLPILIRLSRYHRFAERLRRTLLPEPHWYLAAIAVVAEHRGRGLASRVIRPALDRADESGAACYLETQNPDNVPRYEHYGFVVAASPCIPGTRLRHFAMVRR